MISGFARGKQKTKGILWGIFGRSSDGEINLPDLRRKAGYNLPCLFMDHESYLENGRDLSSRFKFHDTEMKLFTFKERSSFRNHLRIWPNIREGYKS